MSSPHPNSPSAHAEASENAESDIFTQLRLQNSHLPIYRFPPELLNHLFLYVRDGADYEGHSRAVLVLSWVSFHWREVALSDPFLWTVVDQGDNDVLDAFFTRSQNANLSVKLSAESPNDYVQIFQQLGRIDTLHLICPEIDEDDEEGLMINVPVHDDALLRPLWSQPAPNLQTLSLRNFPIPPNPFNNTCPVLRDVKLVWCAFDWDTFPVSTLTDLEITCPADFISPSQFVQKLQQMPLLENLKLNGVLVGMDGSAPVRHRFTRLKTLEIINVDANSLTDFLQMIAVSPATNISVDPTECGDMVPQLIRELRACQDGASKRLTQFVLDVHETTLSVNATTAPEGLGKKSTVRSHFEEWEFNHNIAGDLFAYYDFSAITELTLGSETQDLSRNIWTTTFPPLLHLVSLEVMGAFAYSFIEYFTPAATTLAGHLKSRRRLAGQGIEDIRQNLIFPSLKKLSIYRVGNFEEDLDLGVEPSWPRRFTMFCSSLAVRILGECGIEELRIRRFDLSPAQIGALQKVVGSLEYERSEELTAED